MICGLTLYTARPQVLVSAKDDTMRCSKDLLDSDGKLGLPIKCHVRSYMSNDNDSWRLKSSQGTSALSSFHGSVVDGEGVDAGIFGRGPQDLCAGVEVIP
jgi:hypothetical protein